jgi:nucleoside-diphosphate-sugar epimerase
MAKETKKAMVTGAAGQIGSELTIALREKYGSDNVVATDIVTSGRKTQLMPELHNSGPFEFVDVTKRETIEEVVNKYGIDTIYHMSAILSAAGEKKPRLCWDVNINGTYNILETALAHDMASVFVPSSIAVFGPETPLDNTPQETILQPKTMYGVTKVAGELLCDYYVKRFDMDIRGCRYPGIISYETLPGGGTTDYAVEIFFEAVKNKKYTCFVTGETRLPMMYIPDCLKAALDLMEADFSRLKHYSNFNVTAMSFSARELADEIKKHIPEFECTFEPDFHQAIADSWPNSLDDSAAREEWGWKPDYDLAAMTKDMLRVLSQRYAEGKLDY